ncbi:MAG: response regulator transcription factor [Prevotella sp.]|nr:response regulator transcription factor [Prevotella sp.]
MKVLLADNQGITRAGLMYICDGLTGVEYSQVEDKATLIEQLKIEPESAVILDYTLFDINDAAEMLILCQRFQRVQWLLFSEDLSLDFVRLLLASSPCFSVLLKESPLTEIREAVAFTVHHHRFICQRMAEMLLAPETKSEETVNLTRAETEILKDIALGMTTKEIAEKRFSSFHTVNTHRKNIFRKLGVNNLHEATKYAFRAGLVDSAEYYI